MSAVGIWSKLKTWRPFHWAAAQPSAWHERSARRWGLQIQHIFSCKKNVCNVCSLLIHCLCHHQDSEEIKKLSPAQQKRKIIEILKKIDTNRDDLLSAGRQTCQRASRPKKKWMRTTLLCCAHRGADVVDPARLWDVRAGRRQGKIPRVWHRPGWVRNLGGIQPGRPQSLD